MVIVNRWDAGVGNSIGGCILSGYKVWKEFVNTNILNRIEL